MSINYGDDIDYASSRIRDTIVRHNDEFVYVGHFDRLDDGIWVVSVSDPNGLNSRYVPYDEISLDPIDLGYMNNGSKAIYASRAPARHYKQGLCNNNVRFFGGLGTIYSYYAHACMKGLYNSPLKSFELVAVGEMKSSALSRNFCLKPVTSGLGDKCKLLFRGQVVGSATPASVGNNLNYSLNEEYDFLDEMLEEATSV